MKNVNFFKKISLAGYSLLIITYTLFYYTQLATITDLHHIGSICRIISLMLLAIGIVFQKYSFKEITILFLTFILITIVAYQSNTIDLIITFLTVIALKNVNFLNIVKTDFYTRLYSTLIISFLSVLKYIPSLDVYRSGGAIRRSLGFYHPNLFGAYLMILTFEFIYLGYVNNKLSNRAWIIVPMAVLIEKITDDRSVVVSLLVYLFIYIVLRYSFLKNISSIFFKCLVIVTLVFVSIISIFSAYMYNPTINSWILINRLLSGRPELLNSIVEQFYHVHFWGQNTPLIGDSNGVVINGITKYLFADNAYMGVLIKFGILMFFLFVLWLIRNSFSILNGQNRVIMFCWIVAMLFWGLSENKLLLIQFNILLFNYIERDRVKDKCKNT